MCFRILALFWLSLFIGEVGFAQNTPAQSDSLKLYRDIENFSKKGKVTRFLYRLFFRPVEVPCEQVEGGEEICPAPTSYGEYEGKIIRAIHITPMDPFGYSATDTSVSKHNFLYDLGNRAHIRTH